MSRPRLQFLAIGLVMAAVAAFTAATARADYRASFRNGVQAVERKQWQAGATAMQAAIAENPKDAATLELIYGSHFVPYVPHYYLGVALAKLGNCSGAAAAFATAQQIQLGRFAKNIGNYEVTLQTRGGCGASEPPPVTASATPAPVPASTSTQVASSTQPPPASQPQPAPVTNTSVPVPVTTTVAATTSTQTPVVTVDPRLALARQDLARVIKDAQNVMGSPAAARPAPAGDLAITKRAIDQALGLPASATLLAIQQTTQRLIQQTARLRAADNDPARRAQAAAQLSKAVAAYSQGKYDLTTRLLAGIDSPSRRLTAQAALFRAAAKYSLFVLSGEKNTALRNEMQTDLQKYAALDSAHRPDPRLFSPKFIRAVNAVVR